MNKYRNSKVSGGWMPADPMVMLTYLNNLRDRVEEKHGRPAHAIGAKKKYKHKSIRKFKRLIEEDPVIRMYFTKMIDQVPGYYKGDTEGFYLKSFEEMLRLLDHILGEAPEFNKTELVGFPINAILDWTMGVPAGFAVFRNEKLNLMFKEILHEWSEFLSSKDSLYVLVETMDEGKKNERPGWMSDEAKDLLNMYQYEYDETAAHWGFASWNDFFYRKLKREKDGSYREHPIAEPDNPRVIVSACDSNVCAIKQNVKDQDWFWVKAQPYSLRDMLAKDEGDDSAEHHEKFIKPFIGGDVYQAFLAATKYHRWNSPVSGVVRKAYVKQGLYYSETESEGMDTAGPNDSQGYIAHVATRALIFIEADDPVGLMCVMPIGMAEVSSCNITVEDGARVEKGEPLGYFAHGGSSHCVIFRPGAIEEFTAKLGQDVKMGQHIATAK